MEPDKLHLKISGPLLGKILHERHRTRSSCGGLLYGETIYQTQNQITDAQHTTTSEGFVCVQDYSPRSSNNILKCEKSSDEAWGNSASSRCVGVFKVRKSSMQLSVLEKSMHRKLLRNLKAKGNSQPHDFITSLLITCHTNETGTALSWRIAAYVLHDSCFSPIRIEISNLQGSVSNLYTTNPSPIRTVQSHGANALLQTFQSSLRDAKGGIHVVETTRKTTDDLIQALGDSFSKLLEKEKLLEETLQEKSTLLDELRELQAEKEKLSNNAKVQMHESRKDIQKKHDGVMDSTDHQNLNVQKRTDTQGSEAYGVEEYQMPYKMNKTDLEYVNKAQPVESTVRRISPVVVLEKLNVGNAHSITNEGQSSKTSCQKMSDNALDDPFANLVLSAKEQLSTVTDSGVTNYDMNKERRGQEHIPWSTRTRAGRKSNEKPPS